MFGAAGAIGFAFTAKYKKTGGVAYIFFGDGAINQGTFNESLNLASLWKLPVIFVCQNNRYAEHTTFANSTAVERIALRAEGYNMPGYTVDGNDPDEMYGVAKIAIERARAGDGPTLIEAITYRFNGHLLGDDGGYMDAQEKAAAIASDPVPKLRARLISEGIATDTELAAIESGIESALDDAVEFALASAYPGAIEIKRDVYATELA